MTDVKPKPFVVVRDGGHRCAPGRRIRARQFRRRPPRPSRRDRDRARKRAAAIARPGAAVLTFEPHPRAFFRPDEPLFRLTDERNKLRLFADHRARRHPGHDVRCGARAA